MSDPPPEPDEPDEPFPPFRPSDAADFDEQIAASDRRAERNARWAPAAALAAAAGLVAFVMLPTPDWMWPFAPVTLGWLGFLSTVASLAVLLERVSSGRPARFYFTDPLTEAQYEMSRRLTRRPNLSDEQYHAAFFAASELPPDWPTRALRSLEHGLGMAAGELNALHPQDELRLLDQDVDLPDLAARLEREFEASLPAGALDAWDGTLSGLLRALHDARTGDEPISD